MKKNIIILIAFVFTVSLNAQNRHMSFLGIPINGTIQNFHNKLVSKGFKLYERKSDHYIYIGSFAGYPCELYATFSQQTKTVYDVTLWFDEYLEIPCNYKFDEFEKAIKNKYGKSIFSDYDDDYNVTFYFKINKNDPEEDEEKTYGSIQLYVTHKDFYDEKEYALVLSFEDRENFNKNKKDDMLDL